MIQLCSVVSLPLLDVALASRRLITSDELQLDNILFVALIPLRAVHSVGRGLAG